MANSALPQHIAVIMDGNGRWATQRHLPRKMGHREGAKAVRKLIEHCARLGISVLTLFAFSSENWQRPSDEVDTLMDLFFTNLEKELPTLEKNNIRLRVIGDRSRLSDDLQQRIAEVEAKTCNNLGLTLVLAVSYGGRWDIVQAVQQITRKIEAGELQAEQIDEALIAEHLSLADLPDPDLFIRTSGEQRISNFLIWQLSYTELYFTEKYWPDFTEADLEQAITMFAERERRFGLTAEQLKMEHSE